MAGRGSARLGGARLGEAGHGEARRGKDELTIRNRGNSKMIEMKNAVIEGATLTTNDHGILTAYLALDYDGSGQSFGGYALYFPDNFTNSKKPGNFAGHFIWRVMKIAGVYEWDALVGKTIRVKATNSNVIAIGHIIKDDWFNPTEDFQAMKGED